MREYPPAAQTGPNSLTAIGAVARNGVIGAHGDVPWHIKEDWARFKAVTMGGVLVMGRLTHESIGRLPGRKRLVVTRDQTYDAGGWPVAHTVDQVVQILHEQYPGLRWWSGGGGEMYQLLWPITTDLDICWVDAEPEGDTFFPAIDDSWVETSRTPREGYAFATYTRRAP